MKCKFACADFSFPLLGEKVLSLISLLGIPGVDIGLFENRGWLWPSKELKKPAYSGSQLRKKLDAEGLHLADMFLIAATDFESRAINHPDSVIRKNLREQFLRALEYTVSAGGKHFTTLPGTEWKGVPYDEALARSSEELAWRLSKADQAKISFSVEAHLGSLTPKPAQALRLLKMTPGLTLTLDYGHFIYQGIENKEVHSLIPFASHFHARCGAVKRLQAPFKANAIDFPGILKTMKRSRYAGWIGLEYVWIDWEGCNELDNLSETILLRQHLEKIAEALT